MRLLFYVQRLEDAHLAQALALYLQEHAVASAFAALSFKAEPEQAYLQKTGLFSELLSETELYREAQKTSLNLISEKTLSRIETTYQLPFWHYVTQDRFLSTERANHLFSFGTKRSRESLQLHIQHRFERIEAFVERFKPDAVIYTGVDVGPSSALILERVAKAKNIPVLVPVSGKLGSYHFFIDSVFSKAAKLEQRFKALEAGEVSQNAQNGKDVIAAFRQGSLVLPYVANVKVNDYRPKLEPDKALKRLASIGRLRRQAGGVYHRKYADIYNLSQLEYEAFRLSIEYRNLRLKFGNYFSSPKNEPYIFFPLHVVPELALLLYAPYLTNQLAAVQNVAQSLGANTSLYVKEHPQGVGKKTLRFYKRLKQTPNVKSIYPNINSRQLIANAKGIVTITSTVGLEAMLLGKPTVTLGDVFYNFVDTLIWRAKSIEDVPALVKKFDAFETNERTVENFVSALLDESVNIDPEVLALKLSKLSLEAKLKNSDFLSYAAFVATKLKEARDEVSNG